MNPLEIIQKYYPVGSEAYHILVTHSRSVADKALQIARRHPEMDLDLNFIEEAAMLHDIGIFKCDAPEIDCHGTAPYICHGYLGAELLRQEGFPKHALVCERHTGTGLSLEMIEKQNLPIPYRDMRPVSMEEQLICFADKFYSKTHLDREKSIKKIRNSLAKYGEESVNRFDAWCKLFLGE
ncbi:MAG TPA: phosphohydrolase [Parabacteroides sp.]|nr:phosphohydrolase [Parabacteroides sp.]